jgi:membrane-bound serine protease (ClpP class)
MLKPMLALCAALCLVPWPAAQGARAEGIAAAIDISGAIGPATAEYVDQAFSQARQRDAKVIVIKIDTPGGLSSSMREIIRAILASPIPVLAYVAPAGARAASAGTYIVYASHLAAMAPSTHLGAATPVQLGGGLFGGGKPKEDEEKPSATAPSSAEEAKAINDAVAYIRSLAELRGRNVDWAEDAVRKAATLTASQAKEKHVVDLIADNIRDLLRQADGRSIALDGRTVTLQTAGLTLVTIEPNWRSRILAVLTNPNIAYLLLLAGIYGIVFEFLSPGTFLPGVLGAVAFLLGLYALNLLPINYAGIALLLVGIAMMAGEAFVTSGVLAIGGVAAFLIGSLLLLPGDIPGFALSWQAVALGSIVSIAFILIGIAAVVRAQRRRLATGDPALIGQQGEVLAWKDDEGEVQVWGERWRARSTAPLVPGQRVRVVGRRDLTLLIEPDRTGPAAP